MGKFPTTVMLMIPVCGSPTNNNTKLARPMETLELNDPMTEFLMT